MMSVKSHKLLEKIAANAALKCRGAKADRLREIAAGQRKAAQKQKAADTAYWDSVMIRKTREWNHARKLHLQDENSVQG